MTVLMTSVVTAPLAPSGVLDINNEKIKLRATGFSRFNWIGVFFKLYALNFLAFTLYLFKFVIIEYINKSAFRTLPVCDRRPDLTFQKL